MSNVSSNLDLELPLDDYLGLYVHLPWCVAKCPYCDFNSHPVPETQRGLIAGTSLEQDYTEALLKDLAEELAHLSPENQIDSVFFGGGTPSLFGPRTFAAVLDACADKLSHDVEITLEANPGTQEYADFAGYRTAGINRLSLGAQSFDADQLTTLGRIHSPQETHAAFAKARTAGFERINLDLMYGLPGQAAAGALKDLNTALALEPEHLSWYQLTLEPKTPFGVRPPKLPAEDTLDAMEQAGYAALADADFARYEVSAYARPAEAARHNLRYWTFGDYLGIGAGAHGKRRNGQQTLRRRKAHQPRLYLREPATCETQALAADALPGEFAMNALRLLDGVDAALFEQRTGMPLATLQPTWQALQKRQLLREDRFATTELGLRFLNDVVSAFVDNDS